jgi:hypothetical protein
MTFQLSGIMIHRQALEDRTRWKMETVVDVTDDVSIVWGHDTQTGTSLSFLYPFSRISLG